MCYINNHLPLKNKYFNFLEIINESAIYMSIFFMMIFTDWVPDVELRYSLGYFYIPFIGSIIFINIVTILFEMLVGVYYKCKKPKTPPQ